MAKKKTYVKPEVSTKTYQEILESLGPASAIYGDIIRDF